MGCPIPIPLIYKFAKTGARPSRKQKTTPALKFNGVLEIYTMN